MRGGTTVKIEGLKELDAALGNLPKATARNVLVRTLRKAGEPIAERARQLVPVQTGQLRASIIVSPRLVNKTGDAEFAAVLRSGGSREEARGALIDARRAAKGTGTFATMYVGAGQLPQAHMVEFGSRNNTPHPYLRPAFDEMKEAALSIIKAELGGEILKAASRLAKKMAKAGG